MKLLVCGGRNFNDKRLLVAVLDEIRTALLPNCVDVVIQGGAKGADTLAGEWAIETGIHCAEVKALWDYHGKSAGPIRNRVMCDLLNNKDLVVAFPGGNGTNHMIRTARENRIPVIIVDKNGDKVLDD